MDSFTGLTYIAFAIIHITEHPCCHTYSNLKLVNVIYSQALSQSIKSHVFRKQICMLMAIKGHRVLHR